MLPTKNVIPLNSEEGTFFLKHILPMAFCKLYREHGPNKMALVSILRQQEHPLYLF